MGMYYVEKGTPCIVGYDDGFLKGKQHVTKDMVVWWKEEVVKKDNEWTVFRDEFLRKGKKRKWWMVVLTKYVKYG